MSLYTVVDKSDTDNVVIVDAEGLSLSLDRRRLSGESLRQLARILKSIEEDDSEK
ncbi:MAG: hypothetical protein R3332_09170 [Pseudohongiellaceae bacterium]|nr:hypothetical protein [Pseudohongiellaceae bacterium]